MALLVGDCRGLRAVQSPRSDLQEFCQRLTAPTEVGSSRIDPHLVGYGRIVGGHEMGENQRLDAGRLCDTTGVFGGLCDET